MSAQTIESIFAAMEESHRFPYGPEPVTELEHALQCAELAAAESGDDELVAAALLHDVGRVAARQDSVSDTLEPEAAKKIVPGARGHDAVGISLLSGLMPERVLFCIGAHVAAKRYLCAVEPSYYDVITGGSTHTLKLQGGAMSPDEVAAFEKHPWFDDAVKVRRWDDRAKIAGAETRPLAHWRPLVEKLAAA